MCEERYPRYIIDAAKEIYGTYSEKDLKFLMSLPLSAIQQMINDN